MKIDYGPSFIITIALISGPFKDKSCTVFFPELERFLCIGEVHDKIICNVAKLTL